MSELELELLDPSVAEIDFLEDRLYEFNREATGIDDGQGLGVFVRGDDGEIRAAVAGHTWGGCCEIRQVWVDEPLRRQGLGTRLLAAAEAEARRRGCTQLILNTHSFQAPAFYTRRGYTRVGEASDYPRGHSLISLRKQL